MSTIAAGSIVGASAAGDAAPHVDEIYLIAAAAIPPPGAPQSCAVPSRQSDVPDWRLSLASPTLFRKHRLSR